MEDDDDFSGFFILIFTEGIKFSEQVPCTIGSLAYYRLVALIRLETHEDGSLFTVFTRDGFKIGVHLQRWIFLDLYFIRVGGVRFGRTPVHFVSGD